ncbi:MAG: helix-turn-helix transcriptional regulator [Spirochaetales bacterium]|nr:helix-turn-helix transcriptional regulator [Spirochaetales bacterium]
MSNDIAPKKLVKLSGNEQVKAYVHPTRITLLKMLAREKRTISSIAKELGTHPANITHHFKLLMKTGLIRLVEKRDIGRNIEKYYRAIAYDFIPEPADKSESNKKALALSIVRNDLSVAINTVKNNDAREVVAFLQTARLKRDDVKKIIKQLKDMIKSFSNHDSGEGTAYNLNISLYPNDINQTTQKEIIAK